MEPTETAPARDDRQPNRYLRFMLMIVASTVVMYVLTYVNVFDIAHVRISEERGYMAVVMGCAMAIVMMAFMWRMYPNVRVNALIVGCAAGIGVLAFLGSQLQLFVGDIAYMDAMIPHHSIAILTSNRASISDVRVQQLAQGISDTQVREIKEMTWLVNDISANGLARTQEEAAARAVPSFGPE